MTTALLYDWPKAARFGRVVPKTKFYEHGNVSTALRKRLVDEVRRITWAYKLTDSTINLAGDPSVPEIQVFVVDAKDDDVGDGVLTAIDKAVPFPIIFELAREVSHSAEVRMTAAHKELAGRAPKVSSYVSTPWCPAETARASMPPAINLPTLYKELLAPMLPVAMRAGERLVDATARMEQARKVEREIVKLERRLRTAPQFNRKVELRRELLDARDRLTALIDAQDTPTAPMKDSQWTS